MSTNNQSPVQGIHASTAPDPATGHGPDPADGGERPLSRTDPPAHPLDRTDEIARRGRLMATGTYELTTGQLAVLLACAMGYPLNAQNPAPDVEAFLARTWGDLIAVNPDAANQAYMVGKATNAHPLTTVTLAAVLTESINP